MNQKCISRVETTANKTKTQVQNQRHEIISAAETAAKEIPKITTQIAKQATT